MKQSFISIAILIIILAATVYFVSKAMRYTMRYKTEREKSAIKKSFIAYLLTDSWLISWLVYRKNAGKVSAEIAKLHAETEFEKYRIIQDRLFMSDFDKYMLELEENAKK